MISPNKVESWEAGLTLAFCPILVVVAYTADKQLCCRLLPLRGRWRKAVSPAPPPRPDDDQYKLKEHIQLNEETLKTHAVDEEAEMGKEEESGPEGSHPNAVREERPRTGTARTTTTARLRTATARSSVHNPHESTHGLEHLQIQRRVTPLARHHSPSLACPYCGSCSA